MRTFAWCLLWLALATILYDVVCTLLWPGDMTFPISLGVATLSGVLAVQALHRTRPAPWWRARKYRPPDVPW